MVKLDRSSTRYLRAKPWEKLEPGEPCEIPAVGGVFPRYLIVRPVKAAEKPSRGECEQQCRASGRFDWLLRCESGRTE